MGGEGRESDRETEKMFRTSMRLIPKMKLSSIRWIQTKGPLPDKDECPSVLFGPNVDISHDSFKTVDESKRTNQCLFFHAENQITRPCEDIHGVWGLPRPHLFFLMYVG